MQWFSADQRGLALGVRQTAIPIGGAVAALALPAVNSAAGLKASFLFLGAVCIGCALFAGIAVREAREARGHTRRRGRRLDAPRPASVDPLGRQRPVPGRAGRAALVLRALPARPARPERRGRGGGARGHAGRRDRDEDLGGPDLGCPRREDPAVALDRPGQLRGRPADGGSHQCAGRRRPAGHGRRGRDLDGLERALRDGRRGARGPRAERRCDRLPADDALCDGPDRPGRFCLRGRFDLLGGRFRARRGRAVPRLVAARPLTEIAP